MEIPGVGDQDTVEAAAVAEPAVDLGVYGIPHLWTKPFEDGSIPTGQWWDEHPFASFTSYLGVRSMILAPGPNPFGPFVQFKPSLSWGEITSFWWKFNQNSPAWDVAPHPKLNPGPGPEPSPAWCPCRASHAPVAPCCGCCCHCIWLLPFHCPCCIGIAMHMIMNLRWAALNLCETFRRWT